MLRVHNLEKRFEIEPLFHDVTFTVQPGEHVALVGPNGSGKTTLLKIIAGQERAEKGVVQTVPSDLSTGYLAQGLHYEPGVTLGDFLSRMQGDPTALADRLSEVAAQIVNQGSSPALQAEYDAILAQLEWSSQHTGQLEETLGALSLSDLPEDLPISALSGGQKTRLGLAGILLARPRLLLLDEPTNHLDLDMLNWLEDWLVEFPHAALIVSHDRAFIDAVATAIIELDPLTRTSKRYEGNYSDYLEQKIAERERQWQSYQDQQDEISRLQAAARHMRGIARFRKGGKADSGDKFAKGFFANRGMETIRRAKALEARIERLNNEEHIDKPGRTWQMKMEFGDTTASGRTVLALEDLSVGYGEKVLLDNINAVIRYGQRVALVGPNGSGKTTLLRTIAGTIPALAGSARLGASVRTGYMTQEQESLPPEQNALQILLGIMGKSETEVRAFLSYYMFFGDEVFKPTGMLSYGERARLMLACLVAQGCNFLLLDEPVNHLDIPARARFEQALAGFEGTCLAVVHDRYFIHGYATDVWEVRDGGIKETALSSVTLE